MSRRRTIEFAGTAVVLALSAAVLTTAPANANWPAPPPGTSYWVNGTTSGDLVVIKRSGKKIRIGNPLAPCYTGIRQSDGSYRGGGYNQGGGYTRQRVRFVFQPGQQALKLKQSALGTSPLWYIQYSRGAALRKASPRPESVALMFSDCALR